MSLNPQHVTLTGVMDGAAEELFQQALSRVLENIDDPNTAPKAKRSITLTLSVEVDEERRNAKLYVDCKTKLAPSRPLSTHLHIGRHEGRMAAVEAFRQEEMFPTPNSRPAAVPAAERSA